MTYTPAYLRPGSDDAKAETLDWNLASRPRVPDEADLVPSPHRSPRAEEHLAEGRRLRALRDARDAERDRPRRPMIGPALAALLGVEPTTPPSPHDPEAPSSAVEMPARGGGLFASQQSFSLPGATPCRRPCPPSSRR